MVACTAGDDTPCPLLGGQLGHLVERTTQLEAEHLQVHDTPAHQLML